MFGVVKYKEGDKVVCVTDRLKNFSKNNIYIIEKIIYNKRYATFGMPHLGGTKGFIDKLQLKGIKGQVSHHNFEPTAQDVLRDATISTLLGEEPTTVISTEATTTRKIDEVDSKEYQMFELIMNRIARDRNKLHFKNDYNDFESMISVISKGDRIWGIESKDFDCIKNMTISDLMTLFIKYRQNNNVRSW
jgi:hypothetical protein